MASIVDQAVVLRCWDFSETSQTVAVLCRDIGMLRGLGKGSKRPSGRFGGGFEPLTLGEVTYLVKRESELAVLTEWDLGEVFWGPRRDLDAHHAGFYLADATFHAVLDHDPHPGLFEALISALRGIEDPALRAAWLVRFQWDLLNEIGYRPSVQDVSQTRSRTRDTADFDPHAGGVVAREVSDDGGQQRKGTWRVRHETLDVLRSLEQSAGSVLTLPSGDARAIDRAGRLLAAYLMTVLERELPTARLVFGDGIPGAFRGTKPNKSQT